VSGLIVSRRRVFSLAVAAPAIVRCSSLMAISSAIVTPPVMADASTAARVLTKYGVFVDEVLREASRKIGLSYAELTRDWEREKLQGTVFDVEGNRERGWVVATSRGPVGYVPWDVVEVRGKLTCTDLRTRAVLAENPAVGLPSPAKERA